MTDPHNDPNRVFPVKVCIGFKGFTTASKPPMIYDPWIVEVPFSHATGDGPPMIVSDAGYRDDMGELSTPVPHFDRGRPGRSKYLRAKEGLVVLAWAAMWDEGFFPKGLEVGDVLRAVYVTRAKAEKILDEHESSLDNRRIAAWQTVLMLKDRIERRALPVEAYPTTARGLDKAVSQHVDLCWQMALLGRGKSQEALGLLEALSVALPLVKAAVMSQKLGFEDPESPLVKL